MPTEKPKNTEELILDAAMKVFTRRGFDGARTEEIAREAGINRALLHYYFRDKETMFNLIFETRFREFFGGISVIMQSDISLFEKIKSLIEHEINTFSKHPDLARFVLSEIGQHPERLLEFGKKMNINPQALVQSFASQVEQEVASGHIVPIEGHQLIMNIMSLCIYPFVARPIVNVMLQLKEGAFDEIMEKRKGEIYQFIIKAITK